jgi:hypothetical protein
MGAIFLFPQNDLDLSELYAVTTQTTVLFTVSAVTPSNFIPFCVTFHFARLSKAHEPLLVAWYVYAVEMGRVTHLIRICIHFRHCM